MFGGKKFANLHFSRDLFCDLGVWKCDRNGLLRAKWAFSLGGFYILGVHCLYE